MCIRDRLCAVLAASTVLSGCGGKKTTEGGSTAQAGKEAGKNENGKDGDNVKPVVYKELYSGCLLYTSIRVDGDLFLVPGGESITL